jgi:hypothetical protein
MFKIAASLIAVALGQQEFLKEISDLPTNNVVKNRFGAIEKVIRDDSELFFKEVWLKENNHYYFDYEQQAMHLEEMTRYLKGEKLFKSPKDTDLSCHTWRGGPPNPDA